MINRSEASTAYFPSLSSGIDPRPSAGQLDPASTCALRAPDQAGALIVADGSCPQIQKLLFAADVPVLWLDDQHPLQAVSQALAERRNQGQPIDTLPGLAMAAQASCSLAPPESTAEPFYPAHRTLRVGALAVLPSGAALPALIKVLSVFSRNSLEQPCGRAISKSAVLLTAIALGAFQIQAKQKYPLVHLHYPSNLANNWPGIISWVASQQTRLFLAHLKVIHSRRSTISWPLRH